MMSWHARAMFRESIVFLVGRYGKIITCGLSTQNPKLAELWNGIGSSPAKHKISLNFDQLQSKYSLPFGQCQMPVFSPIPCVAISFLL